MKTLVLAAALIVAALACGHKGAVLAPELVRPEPPTDLGAAATPDGVQLTWTRPVKYSGGQRIRDLGSFLVDRADADATPPAFARIGTVELQDQTRFRPERRLTFTDHAAVPGGRYLYRVSARTLDGYDSPAAGPVSIRFTPPAADAAPPAPAEKAP